LEPGDRPLHLHTSPEYAMKRLLAAGSGDIYQIAHVVRGRERSRLHNPEFTLIEWYRLGFTLEALMSEVDRLVRELLEPRPEPLGSPPSPLGSERITYRDAFLRELGLDPLTAAFGELEQAASRFGYTVSRASARSERSATDGGAERDELLDLLMATAVGPRLGQGSLTFVHRYPASQAALAAVSPEDPRVALRFELYCEGVELANGFRELGASDEQRARFEADQAERRRRGLPVPALDERLLAALAAGLPACSGVALGFDRLLMIAVGARHIHAVLPFPTERA
ncbi:MAG: EF-P lysine aminoacylase EpmA, partial [Steroidobacteraceae bacterium]